jgi:hypothetical protein
VLAFCFALDASDGDFMNDSHPAHIDLQVMARQIMLEHGFEPDLPATVQEQLADIKVAAAPGISLFQGCARPAQPALVVD